MNQFAIPVGDAPTEDTSYRAVTAQYGSTFSDMKPSEDWEICHSWIDENKVAVEVFKKQKQQQKVTFDNGDRM